MSHELKQVLQHDLALTNALRHLPRAASPMGMTTSLRVLASRERERAIHKVTWKSQFNNWVGRVHLSVENVMRPLALPVAGGVFSAVTLFSVWVVPAYPEFARTGLDVPTQLSTEARVKGFSSIATSGEDIVMDVTLDDRGRVVEYKVLSDVLDVMARRKLENMLVFETTFVPATSFGQPTASKIRLWLNSRRFDVNVRG
ncbi:MAG: hypothetical protein ABIR70_06310 [Bryobacteraceae bacterium]